MTNANRTNANRLLFIAAAVVVARLAGCGTQAPQGPAAPDVFRFELSPAPIDGFTFVHTDVVAEAFRGRPPLNTGRSFAAAAVLNDRIYAIGGNNANLADFDSVEVFDVRGSAVWTAVASMPGTRTGASAAAANGRIYVLGGFRDGVGPLSDTLEYNPDTNQWTPRAPLLKNRCFAAAAAVNNRIYLIGGASFENGFFVEQSSVDEYNPATDTWTPKAPLHTPRRELAAAALNGRIYALGGIGGTNANTSNEEYDPATNVWTPKAAIPHGRDGLAAFSWNGGVYAVGGRQLNGQTATRLPFIEVYSPVSDIWGRVMDLPFGRSGFGGAAIGPSFFVFGGDIPGVTPAGQVGVDDSLEYFARTRLHVFRED